MTVADPINDVDEIEIFNNLFLADPGPDIAFVGKDRLSVDRWRLEGNWREISQSNPASPEAKEWILSAKDTVADKVALVSRDANDPDFLRPVKGSPIAVAGEKNSNPSLPKYIGAVPPEGVEPWDWQNTWDARMSKVEPLDSDKQSTTAETATVLTPGVAGC